jgi:hypothetical protein
MENNYRGKEVKLDCSQVSSHIKFLQGKVLTIIEASVDDSKLKAVKDLVKGVFSDQLTYVLQQCLPELPIVNADSLESRGIDTLKLASEAEAI